MGDIGDLVVRMSRYVEYQGKPTDLYMLRKFNLWFM